MKNIFFFIAVFSLFFTSFSQEKQGKPFLSGSINLTFGVNENYVLFEPDDNEYFLEPVAILVRTGFGYQFNRRFATSLNVGFDHHWKFGINAIPTFGTLHYNITEKDDDTFFVTTSYGKMWRLNSKYSDGNYYGLGLGFQFAGEKRWNTVIKLEFNRKTITGFKNNRLDGLSLGFGFTFM